MRPAPAAQAGVAARLGKQAGFPTGCPAESRRWGQKWTLGNIKAASEGTGAQAEEVGFRTCSEGAPLGLADEVRKVSCRELYD